MPKYEPPKKDYDWVPMVVGTLIVLFLVGGCVHWKYDSCRQMGGSKLYCAYQAAGRH